MRKVIFGAIILAASFHAAVADDWAGTPLFPDVENVDYPPGGGCIFPTTVPSGDVALELQFFHHGPLPGLYGEHMAVPLSSLRPLQESTCCRATSPLLVPSGTPLRRS